MELTTVIGEKERQNPLIIFGCEIESGETSIQENPFLRVVEVIQVRIYKEGKTLIEYEQEFKEYRQ